MLVTKHFGANLNFPKSRAIREIYDINLKIFNCTSFYDGREVESSGGDLKRLKARHSNWKSPGDKDVMMNRLTRLAFHYLLVGGVYGHKFQLKCGADVKNIPHPTKDDQPHPLLVSFFRPQVQRAKRVEANGAIQVHSVAKLKWETHVMPMLIGMCPKLHSFQL